MEKTSYINVLISSKQSEFKTERADIRSIMKPLPLLVAEAAEDWPPQSSPIQEVFLEAARNCGIYVGLFGCVYSAPTIQEFDAAAENPNRQILVYVKECPNRDPELTGFLNRVKDPVKGRTIATFSDWNSIRGRFEQHLWSAIGRMIEYLLKLGEKPKSMGSVGPMNRRWEEQNRPLLQLGLPTDKVQALDLARALTELRNGWLGSQGGVLGQM